MSINPIRVQKFLRDVDYPVERDDLIRIARANGADEVIITELRSIPSRTYRGPDSVSRAVSH